MMRAARLHPVVWSLVKSTKNSGLVDETEESLVDNKSTIVDWRETHFRALLSHLSESGWTGASFLLTDNLVYSK